MLIDVADRQVPRRVSSPGRHRHAAADRLGDDASIREGRVNLAPFSFFNAFGANPPVVVFSPTLRRDGSRRRTRCATSRPPASSCSTPPSNRSPSKVNLSSKELPYGESEVELTGLTRAPSLKVKPPRLAESPVNLECKVRQIVPIGDGPIAANLVIGEVLVMHIDDAVLDEQGRVDPRKLRTIARLGGDWYCRTTDLFEMKRPT